ncbi:MAG: hypothetical protein AAB508_03340 [Patescibacteria group bacterium]
MANESFNYGWGETIRSSVPIADVDGALEEVGTYPANSMLWSDSDYCKTQSGQRLIALACGLLGNPNDRNALIQLGSATSARVVTLDWEDDGGECALHFKGLRSNRIHVTAEAADNINWQLDHRIGKLSNEAGKEA